MKKICITILMFLAIFLNIDSVRANLLKPTETVQYEAPCVLTGSGGNYCNYTCKVSDAEGNYYKLDLQAKNTAGIEVLPQNITFGGPDCRVFPKEKPENNYGNYKPACQIVEKSDSKVVDAGNDEYTYYGEYEYSGNITEYFRDESGNFRCPSLNISINGSTYLDGGMTHKGEKRYVYTKKFEINIIRDDSQVEEDMKDFENNTTTDYCSIFGENITPLIKWGLGIIRIAVALIFVVMTILDFLKLAGTGEEKSYKDALNKFIKRLIIVVLIEVLPVIISILIDISGILEQYNIQGDIFCSLF